MNETWIGSMWEPTCRTRAMKVEKISPERATHSIPWTFGGTAAKLARQRSTGGIGKFRRGSAPRAPWRATREHASMSGSSPITLPDSLVSTGWLAENLHTPGLRIFDCTCRSEEHTSELQSLMRISYAVFCLKKKNK